MKNEALKEIRLGSGLLLIMLLALALRIPMLGVGIWFDEIRLTTEFGRASFSALFTEFGSDNNHPLYTILSWLSIHTFGESTWALRLPALIFGIFSIATIAQFSGLILGAKRAYLIAFLVAISYHHVWFSNNARGYTALLFFTVLATQELLNLLDDRGRERLLSYSLSLACATFVHSTAIFVALTHLLVVLIYGDRARWRGVLGIVLAGFFSLMLHSFMLKDMISFFLGAEGHAKVASEWTNPLWTLYATGASFGLPAVITTAALVIAAIFLIMGLIRLHQIDQRLNWLFLMPAILGAGSMILLQRNIWPRFFFNLLGFFLIIAIASLDRVSQIGQLLKIRPRRVFLGLSGLMILSFLIILPRALTTPKQDFSRAMAYLDQMQLEGHTVAALGLARLPFQRYYERDDFVYVDTFEQLEILKQQQRNVLAVDTLTTFTKSRMPQIAKTLEEDFEVLRIFRGSVGGGDVIIYRLK